MFKPLLAVALLSTLAACSGGGSSDGPAPEVNANPAGIWRGTLTDMLQAEANPDNPDVAKHDLFVMADAAGNVRIISTDARGEFLGRGELRSIEDSEFSGYLDVYSYNPTSQVFDPDSKKLRFADFTGKLSTRGEWTGDIEFNDLKLYAFSATFDEAESLKGASAQILGSIGTFFGPSPNEGESISLTFASDGTFTGADHSCAYRGTATVPDSAYNLYEFTLKIEGTNSCPAALRDTKYGGMGTLVDQDGVRTLKLLVKNSNRILVFNLQ